MWSLNSQSVLFAPPASYAAGMLAVFGVALALRPALRHLALEQLGRAGAERFCVPDGPMDLIYLR